RDLKGLQKRSTDFGRFGFRFFCENVFDSGITEVSLPDLVSKAESEKRCKKKREKNVTPAAIDDD
ncbi:unnamed protein product, partial [Didymodactylos carnosus]